MPLGQQPISWDYHHITHEDVDTASESPIFVVAQKCALAGVWVNPNKLINVAGDNLVLEVKIDGVATGVHLHLPDATPALGHVFIETVDAHRLPIPEASGVTFLSDAEQITGATDLRMAVCLEPY